MVYGFSQSIENNYKATIKNFGIDENINDYNEYMNNYFKEIDIKIFGFENLDNNFKDKELIEEIIDFIYRNGLIKYIYMNNISELLPKSKNILGDIAVNIVYAKYLWYETYYRYFLVYLDEIFISICNKNFVGFTIHYRQLQELDLFSNTYHNLGLLDQMFYGISAIYVYFKRTESEIDFDEIKEWYNADVAELAKNLLKKDVLIPLLKMFYDYVGPEKENYYQVFITNIINKIAKKGILENRILFGLKNKKNKMVSINLEEEIKKMNILEYKKTEKSIEETYIEPSESVHPNNIKLGLKSNGKMFDFSKLSKSELDVIKSRLHQLNNFLIPLLISRFQLKKINLNGKNI